MKRRKFIKNSLLLSSGVISIGAIKYKLTADNDKSTISGFIISDAHIGYKGKDQPSIALQTKLVRHIKQRFPNLDLVFDTGDIHHGNLNEKQRLIARNQWLTNIANVFSESLFHYIPGNHELGRGKNDTELTASMLGSQNLKPYYSFDYKGIHFVSLPQLMDTILINQESLDWLKQDLELNKKKTTLIFSHNSIAQTTYNNGESGYRVTVNSNEVLDIINKYNVIAWLHGHNHQYEIVKKNNRLYVSNGRIGGFNPPNKWGSFGQGHLGGIYFEINKKGIIIKCYSATKKDFLENLGFPSLTNSIQTNTSFSESLPTNYYYGYGAITQNVQVKIYNHYLSNYNSLIYLKSLSTNIINDNFDFRYTNDLFFAGRKKDRVIGYQIQPKSIHKSSIKTGLLIQNPTKDIKIKFPTQKERKKGILTRGSYYRCYPGDNFTISLLVSNESKINIGRIEFSYIIKNQSHENIFSSRRNSLIQNNNSFTSSVIHIPKKVGKNKLNKYYIYMTVNLLDFSSNFVINHIKLSKISTSTKENFEAYVVGEGKQPKIIKNRELPSAGELSFYLPNIDKKTSILIKVPEVKWQIRNAIATIKNNTIHILSYRHSFQSEQAVILTSTKKRDFYINIIKNTLPCKIEYEKDTISFKTNNINDNSQLTIVTNQRPEKLIGVKLISYIGSQLVLKVLSNNVLIKLV